MFESAIYQTILKVYECQYSINSINYNKCVKNFTCIG